MRRLAIRIGHFFFRYRNKAFPIFIVALYAFAAPPIEVFGSEKIESLKDALAVVIAIVGLTIRGAVIGFAYIKRGGLNKRVYAKDLVTDGMFGISRNPLYVGNLIICLAIFLMHGDVRVLLVGGGFYLLIYRCIVAAEEAYLTDRFGEAYRRYCAEVPRWLPKLTRLPGAVAGMRFNPRRILQKDYTTIALTFSVLIVTESYEYLATPDWRTHLDYIGALMVLLALFGSCAWLIRRFNKRSARV